MKGILDTEVGSLRALKVRVLVAAGWKRETSKDAAVHVSPTSTDTPRRVQPGSVPAQPLKCR